MPAVSIVITTYNRANLLRSTFESFASQTAKDYEAVVVDDGSDADTPALCAEPWPFPVRYFRLNRPPSVEYRNQSVAINYGVRQAEGKIIILQNAECRHVGNVIRELCSVVTPHNAVLCTVEHLNPDGSSRGVVEDIAGSRLAIFFCGAIYKEWFEKLRGFDEDYQFWGAEDNDFSARLAESGVTFAFLEAVVEHQWHPTAGVVHPEAVAKSTRMLTQKTEDMRAGKIGAVRNLDREWGQP